MVSDEEREFRDALVKDVADYFHSYIGTGVRVPGPAEMDSDEWDDPTPALNIDDLRGILRVHFLMSGASENPAVGEADRGVTTFMQRLPDRIRRLKSNVVVESEVVRGGVQGKIDWPGTTDMYRKQGFVDRTRFVCTRQDDDLDTTANRVLRELLLKIRSIFEDELAPAVEAPEDYPWLGEWLQRSDGESLFPMAERVLRENSVMRDLRILEDQHPHEVRDLSLREIRTVKQTRRPIYREAAHLLERYQALVEEQDFSEEEARGILTNGYIRPDSSKGDRLFELYWIYSLLDGFENPGLRTIQAGTNLVAQWERDGREYELYHTGGNHPLEFKIPLREAEAGLDTDEPHEGYFERSFAARERSIDYAYRAFSKDRRSRTMWSGTPDILLLQSDAETGNLERILVGEVKYSSNTSYLKEGIQELLEYVYLMKDEGGLIIDAPYAQEEIPAIIEPVLFTDGLGETVDDDDLPISIVQYPDRYVPFSDDL
jgi:hypothetical protein